MTAVRERAEKFRRKKIIIFLFYLNNEADNIGSERQTNQFINGSGACSRRNCIQEKKQQANKENQKTHKEQKI